MPSGELVRIDDLANTVRLGTVRVTTSLGILQAGSRVIILVGPQGSNGCDSQVLQFAVAQSRAYLATYVA